LEDPYKIFKKRLFFSELLLAIAFRHVTKEIIRILQDTNCNNVLDVCCGTGTLSKAMTKKGMDVTGMDMSRTMLDRAIKKKRAKRLIFQDATTMNFEEEFDAAVIKIALHEMSLEVRTKVFEKMKMAVKQDGILIVADFSHTKNESIKSRINGHFIEKAEESFLDTYPDHHTNYKAFMKNGGVTGFLEAEKIISENYFMGGHLGIIAITK
jgi:ubiquinone/menaquinone biosynthesis C-methylase UbiE